ncbi:unnamed protein product [Urochloa decumbens]|uniref:Uncharacterized protein n=1 Tax=Urochloa decumbens TaxID=240449 RepID=A0ABC9A008_9POAL
MEAGYCNRKKTDICEGVCDNEVSPPLRSRPDLSLSLPHASSSSSSLNVSSFFSSSVCSFQSRLSQALIESYCSCSTSRCFANPTRVPVSDWAPPVGSRVLAGIASAAAESFICRRGCWGLVGGKEIGGAWMLLAVLESLDLAQSASSWPNPGICLSFSHKKFPAFLNNSRLVPVQMARVHAAKYGSKSVLSMSRLKCALRGFDLRALLILLIGVPILIFVIYVHGQKVTYFLRPIWEKPPKPFTILPHYYHENVSMGNLCKLHGWKVRETPRRVFDAVLFSNELDILDIRWHELSPYVSEFVLLESNSTFTGIKKDLHFKENRQRFEFAESRLTYGMIGGRFVKGENPFVEESYQRVALDQLIKIAGITDDDLLIMSDVDEIPSGHTINLLRWCDDIPEILHLQLRNYLYSFQFLLDDKSWRASVHRYRAGKTRYAHFRQTDALLADSGWHCSFCFRYINDFIFKMKAYSHVDRIRFKYFLNPKRIQHVICEGADLFDMIPEEYTFQEIIAKLGPIPSTFSAVHLPAYLLEQIDRYRYLLPGNCMRETGSG